MSPTHTFMDPCKIKIFKLKFAECGWYWSPSVCEYLWKPALLCLPLYSYRKYQSNGVAVRRKIWWPQPARFISVMPGFHQLTLFPHLLHFIYFTQHRPGAQWQIAEAKVMKECSMFYNVVKASFFIFYLFICFYWNFLLFSSMLALVLSLHWPASFYFSLQL